MYSKHTIIGNLGRDPEMRFTLAGQAVTNFTVCVNRRWNDAQGQAHDEKTWYKVVAWGKLAEVCDQYLSQGKQVLVEGDRIKVEVYTNREGQAAASMELTAQTVKFLGGGKSDGSGRASSSQVSAEDYTDEIPF